MNKRDAEVQVSSNVTITVLNKKNEVVQTIKKHNKATVVMVEGLLHFLQGWYSNTEHNESLGGGNPEDSLIYIPTKIGFGNIGVYTQVESTYGDVPMFLSVNSGDFVQPTFNSSALQSLLLKWKDKTDEVGYRQFTNSMLTSYEDLNNSESLCFTVKVSPGQLVGENFYSEDGSPVFTPYERSFYNPELGQYCTMITEIGLFSSENTLLARVLLDAPVVRRDASNRGDKVGYTYQFEDPESFSNPIIQTEDTTLVVEWNIGLISVSDQDKFITQSNNLLATSLADDLSSLITTYIEEKDEVPDKGDLTEMIIDCLSGYNSVTQN